MRMVNPRREWRPYNKMTEHHAIVCHILYVSLAFKYNSGVKLVTLLIVKQNKILFNVYWNLFYLWIG
jgi:hypothetical protein